MLRLRMINLPVLTNPNLNNIIIKFVYIFYIQVTCIAILTRNE